jgi:FAD:protein FMN transferase
MSVLHVRQSQNHMATTFHFTISTTANRVTAAEVALAECHRAVQDCEQQLSEYLPSSPVYQINHACGEVAFPATAPLRHVFSAAEIFRAETDNAFHYGAKGEQSPNPPFELQGPYLKKLNAKAWLGFGAIGKGYALDRARQILAQAGFEDYCLNAGGSSILLQGFSAPDEPWKWAWSWSRSESGAPRGIEFEHTSGRPIGIGVSGTQEKGAHLIDGNATHSYSLQSALVAAASATEADALSTALFVSGWEKFSALPCVRDRELSTAAIDTAGVPLWNGWFYRWWGALASVVLAVAPLYAGVNETAPIVRAAAGLAKQAAPATTEAKRVPNESSNETPPSQEDGTVLENELAGSVPSKAAMEIPAEGNNTDLSNQDPINQDPGLETGEVGAAADGAIDLSDLGIEQFNPYLFERDPLWILLPLAALALVLLHLKRIPKPKQNPEIKP